MSSDQANGNKVLSKPNFDLIFVTAAQMPSVEGLLASPSPRTCAVYVEARF